MPLKNTPTTTQNFLATIYNTQELMENALAAVLILLTETTMKNIR